MAVNQIPGEDIMRRIIPFCTLIFGLLLALSPVEAQQNCAPRDHIILRLATVFGEVRRGVGLSGNGSLVEIYASEATGTWTLVFTDAQGVSCLVAAGQSWETVAPVALPDGDPL